MKMKIWLYVSYFVVFFFVFTQIAFPVGTKVKSIKVRNMGSAESVPAFNEARVSTDNAQTAAYEYLVKAEALKDKKGLQFIEYEIEVESTSIIPVEITNIIITAGDKYKNRVIMKAEEAYEKEISAAKASIMKFKLLADTGGMSQEEIHEMIRNIDIHIAWKAMPGWERENKVTLPERNADVAAFLSFSRRLQANPG